MTTDKKRNKLVSELNYFTNKMLLRKNTGNQNEQNKS